MADAAAARREARRRKILENSQNRLQRISGKCEGEFARGSPIRTLLPEENYQVPVVSDSSTSFRTVNSLNNGVVVTEALAPESPLSDPNYGRGAVGDGFADVANDLTALLSPTPEQPNAQAPTLLQKLISYKYDVVLVSLLVQLLYSWSLLTFDETYFFLPLVVYVVTKIIWFPAPSNSNFANALLLLNGVSLDRVEKIMSMTRWISIFSQDVCVYLFTTICTQALYTTIKDCFIT